MAITVLYPRATLRRTHQVAVTCCYAMDLAIRRWEAIFRDWLRRCDNGLQRANATLAIFVAAPRVHLCSTALVQQHGSAEARASLPYLARAMKRNTKFMASINVRYAATISNYDWRRCVQEGRCLPPCWVPPAVTSKDGSIPGGNSW